MNKTQKVAAVVALALGALLLFKRASPVPPPPPSLGNLYGRVTDSVTGQPVAGVLVTLAVDLNAHTDANGGYAFGSITPGEHGVAFIKDGYQTIGFGIVLAEGRNVLNIRLVPLPTVGGLSNLQARPIFADGSQFLITFKITNNTGQQLNRVLKYDNGRDPGWGEQYITIHLWEPPVLVDFWLSAITIKTVSLAPGQSKTVGFVFNANMPGMWRVFIAAGDESQPIPQHTYGDLSQSFSVVLISQTGQVPGTRLISVEEVEIAIA